MSSPVDTESRRRLLRTLAQGGAALGTVALLPDRWTKPVVDTVIVPLHAQTSTPRIDPPTLSGIWIGSWTDTSTGTGGAASVTVTVDAAAQTFLLVLDLNGQVLGNGDPTPQSWTGSYTGAGATIRSREPGFFGFPVITISPIGAISGSIAPLPQIGSIQLAGTVSATNLVVNYTATTTIAAIPHAGTLTLTKS